MKSIRHFTALILLFSLAACGFEPLHATHGSTVVNSELAAVRIAPIAERSGQILRNYLLDRLTPQGTALASRYSLQVELSEPRQTLALRRDDVISRASYSATASFNLVDSGGKRLMSGTSSFTTDYEITNSEYATLASIQSARERVLELVSDDIRSQLAVFLRAR